ncbi:hypothetical protein ACOME3_007511 [Neoechinorhynchus agilis]
MVKQKSEWTKYLVSSCIIACISASFMFGYGIGAPNQYSKFTEPFLDKKFELCDVNEETFRIENKCPNVASVSFKESATKSDGTKDNTDLDKLEQKKFDRQVFVQELINGISQTLFVVGNLIGAITGPYWLKCSRFFDRRRIFYANYPFTYLFAILIIVSYYKRCVSLFYISRFVHGIQGGMACLIVPPYLNEISPQSLRGITGTFHQLFITIGILVGQLLGIPPLFGRYQYWAIGLAMGSITSIFAFFVTPFLMVDSPPQMANVYKNQEKAKAALRKLKQDPAEIDTELMLLNDEANKTKSTTSISILALIRDPRLRPQLITTLVLMGVQALCGINAVFFYSGKMFRVAGISEANLPYSTVCTGVVNVIVTIAVLPLIDRFGRRPLIIYPMGVMVALFIALTVLVEVNATRQSATIAWFAVILIVLFIVAFAIGLGPIPFIYACEVFRPEARDAALSLGMCINYFFNILLCLFFPAINAFLRGYVFVIFGGVVLGSLVILAAKMPETKNKSIEQIEMDMRGDSA